jgi:hypothetical protein
MSEMDRLRGALLRISRYSHAKDFSHHGVAFEDCDKESCAAARADLLPRTVEQAIRDGWVYEDTLPKTITQQEYDWWYDRSAVLDGVRMGSNLSRCSCCCQRTERGRG